jgi:hypothetical protein
MLAKMVVSTSTKAQLLISSWSKAEKKASLFVNIVFSSRELDEGATRRPGTEI